MKTIRVAGVDEYLLNCFKVDCNKLTLDNIGTYEKEFIYKIDNFQPNYNTLHALGYDREWSMQ